MNNNTMISQLSIVPRNALRVSATLRNRALDFFGNFFIQTSETRTNGLSRNGYSILIPRLVETDRNIRTQFTIYLAFIYFNLVVSLLYCFSQFRDKYFENHVSGQGISAFCIGLHSIKLYCLVTICESLVGLVGYNKKRAAITNIFCLMMAAKLVLLAVSFIRYSHYGIFSIVSTVYLMVYSRKLLQFQKDLTYLEGDPNEQLPL